MASDNERQFLVYLQGLRKKDPVLHSFMMNSVYGMFSDYDKINYYKGGTMKKFWLVWNQSYGAPTFKHDTEESAKKEAARLAQKYPGQKFDVLQSVCTLEVNNVKCTNHYALKVF